MRGLLPGPDHLRAMSNDREARTVGLNEAIVNLLEYENAEILMKNT